MDDANRSAREHVAEILSALGDGDNEGAADLAAQGLAVFPDAASFHRLRGIALFALGANEEAKAHLAATLAVDPLDNVAIIALARLADAEADPYTAAEHLLTAWEHDPANPALRAELTKRLAALYGPEGYLQFTRPALAALYVRNIYPERAAREYRAILAAHPNRTDLRVAAALAQWRLGNLAETVEECAAMLAEQSNVVPARWALADATARLSNGDLAREYAKQAARLDPDGAIARMLIAGNPDAAIVDPDEPLRVPENGRARISLVAVAPPVVSGVEEDAMMPEPDARETEPDVASPAADAEEPAPKSDTMRLVETLSGLAAALAAAQATDADLHPLHEPSEVAAAYVATPEADAAADVPPEPEFTLPGAAGLAEALAALDAPDDVPMDPSALSLPNPLDVPYAEPEDEQALAETPIPTEDNAVPVIAVIDEDGAILATQPGGEPSFDAADALPNPPTPFPPREGGEIWEDVPPRDVIAAMRAKMRAGDIAGAVGGMRAALMVAGTDHDQLHALLPGLRALVDAAPERPDAHRLLGDVYARLGLYAQAQGQYRQALLVRIAGKGAR
jgi:tetratricopeptide (TPR) repeat protein